MSNVFLGRQPILDRDRNTFGFELLYREGSATTSLFDNPDDASRIVMERALLSWGMERIIGDRFGFINVGPNLIGTGIHRALPPEGIIFEIREDEEFDGQTIEAFRNARRDGYHFALDNVTGYDSLRRSQLLPYMSMVKIEAGGTSIDELTQLVRYARHAVPGVSLVAEKVEDLATFVTCSDAGIDLFQGYFFAEPEILSRAARPIDSAAALALMAEMQRDDIGIDEIVLLVATDPTLAYRLLSVVNSSAFGLNRKVESLRHAIVMLGLSQVRHLAVLLALGGGAKASEELIALGAQRARLASQLEDDPDKRHAAFTVGLLSVTDAIFQTPMDELLRELPISDDIADALLWGTGPHGRTLRIVRACETADVQTMSELLPEGVGQLHEAYGEAIVWANQIRGEVRRPAPV